MLGIELVVEEEEIKEVIGFAPIVAKSTTQLILVTSSMAEIMLGMPIMSL